MSRPTLSAKPRNLSVRTARHTGITLIEISLGLAVVALSTTWLARNMIRENQQLMAQTEAAKLLELQTGMQAYLNRYKSSLVLRPDQPIEVNRNLSDGSPITVTLLNGYQPGQTFWPGIDQLKELGLLPASQTPESAIAVNRPFMLGPIRIHPLDDPETTLADTSTCLLNGCVLRMLAYPEPVGPSSEPAPQFSAVHSPVFRTRLINVLGNSALSAHDIDGRFYGTSGQYMGANHSNSSQTIDYGVFAEVRIPAARDNSQTDLTACAPGHFGFNANASSRNPATQAEYESNQPTRCVAAHGHLPLGQQTLVYDFKSPYTGFVRLVCEVDGSGALVVHAAMDASDPLGPSDMSCNN